MYEVKSIIRPERLAAVVRSLHEIPDIPGLTVSAVRGFGRRTTAAPGAPPEYGETEMAKLETVVPADMLQRVIQKIQDAGSTGRAGDGKVFVSRVEDPSRSVPGRAGQMFCRVVIGPAGARL